MSGALFISYAYMWAFRKESILSALVFSSLDRIQVSDLETLRNNRDQGVFRSILLLNSLSQQHEL